MVAVPGPQNNIDLTRLTGGFIAGFSFVMGLLVLFVVPGGGCSFLGAIELLILAFLFLMGISIFLFGHIRVWRKRRSQAA